jgi:hypothetical protein
MDFEKRWDGCWVSTRAREGKISAIKEMAMLSARVGDAASLAWGLPSFRTPEPIRRAIEKKLESDPAIGMYALPDGLPELREAVAREHRRTIGVAVDPDLLVNPLYPNCPAQGAHSSQLPDTRVKPEHMPWRGVP